MLRNVSSWFSCSSEDQDPRSASLHKIYETLQVPKASLSAASPLYPMMPEVERKKTELSIKETSASKSRAKMLVVREPGMSVTDTAKKVMNKIENLLGPLTVRLLGQ